MLPMAIIAGLILVVLIFIALMFLKPKKDKNLHEEVKLPLKEVKTPPKATRRIEKKSVESVETIRIDPHLYDRIATAKLHSHHSAKSQSAQGKKDLLNDEVSQFQTASTILSSTCWADEDKERRYFEKMIITFNKIFDNLNGEDIKFFCKQHKVSSLKRAEHNANPGVNLEIDENYPCSDSNLWLVSYKNSEQHRILPGTILLTTFKTLNAENARALGEIFRGIMLIVPGNKFEVVEPAIAEKRNGAVIITKIGKLGVLLGGSKR